MLFVQSHLTVKLSTNQRTCSTLMEFFTSRNRKGEEWNLETHNDTLNHEILMTKHNIFFLFVCLLSNVKNKRRTEAHRVIHGVKNAQDDFFFLLLKQEVDRILFVRHDFSRLRFLSPRFLTEKVNKKSRRRFTTYILEFAWNVNHRKHMFSSRISVYENSISAVICSKERFSNNESFN